jgi:uncharacterized protein
MRSARDKSIGRGSPQNPKVGLNSRQAVSNFLSKGFVTLFIILCSLFSITVSAQDIKLPERPDPPHLVNDLAGMLNAGQASALENKLVAYDDSTSTQIAIVTISSLGGADAAQYATELSQKWGIGRKKKDNGVLLFISKNDHKVFIATGRGAEATLPDIICKQIIDHVIKPRFKAGNYYDGINAATDQMMARLSGQFVNDEPDKAGNHISIKFIALIVVAIFLLIILLGGGGGGQTYDRSGSSGMGGFLGGMLLGSLLGGGGSGGGGSDSGGGGFGGFGGGSFGGGGAGGDW